MRLWCMRWRFGWLRIVLLISRGGLGMRFLCNAAPVRGDGDGACEPVCLEDVVGW